MTTDPSDPEDAMTGLRDALRLSQEQLSKALGKVDGLLEAESHRAVIEQAKGMLMARSSMISADDAFELLARASQRENVRVRDIALRIVERRSPDEGL